jgi:hypothetical protein
MGLEPSIIGLGVVIQHNNITHNYIQHNDIQHDDTQHHILNSSSRGNSSSALHSYSKRRFIRPFAPPCILFTFSSVVVSWWVSGGQWDGESWRGVARRKSGESRLERAKGRWLPKIF